MNFPTDRLVNEALAKSGLLWVYSAAGDGPVWHATVNGVAYIVCGEGEQNSPLHDGRCEVVARSKESRARLISFDADADPITPESPEWAAATFALRAGRLNAPAGDTAARWAAHNTVIALRPDLSTVVLRGKRLPAPSPAAPEQEPESAPQPATARTSSAPDHLPTPAKVSK